MLVRTGTGALRWLADQAVAYAVTGCDIRNRGNYTKVRLAYPNTESNDERIAEAGNDEARIEGVRSGLHIIHSSNS
jgi:hypothetical protein